MSDPIKEYDENLRFARYVVEVDLLAGKYRTTLELKVRGNVKGYDVIDAAIEGADEDLYEVAIAMVDDEGHVCTLEPCQVGGLKGYVIAARIVKVVPDNG